MQKEYKKLTGYTDSQPAQVQQDDPKEIMYKMMDNIASRINYVHDRIDRSNQDSSMAVASVHKKINDHMSVGHLPAIKSVKGMKKAMKALGCEEEADVRPSQTIYASTMTNKGLEVDVEYVKPQK